MMVARVKRLASAVILVAVTIALYRKAIRLWWILDDPGNLHAALTRPWTDALHAAQPFLLASHEALLRLAGLDPDLWYRVQVGLIALAAIALFLTLRLLLGTLPSLGGALLFVAGPPLCVAATQLRTIDALEAIILGAVSVGVYLLAFHRQSFLFELLSAVLYFLAMVANPLAIPLPLLLFLVPEKPLRVRVRHLLMHGVALLGLLVWRRPAFGLSGSPWSLLTALTGDGVFFGSIALAILAIGVVFGLRSHRGRVIALGGLAAVSLAQLLGAQDAFAAWLWICVAFSAGAASLSISPRVVVFVAAIAAVIVANRQEWTAEHARARRMGDEARVFMNLDGASLLRKPAIPPTTMAELRWLKESHLRRALGAGWFYDDLYLCEHFLRGRHIYEYHEAMRQVVEVTARIPDFAEAYCGKIRDDVPLRAEFHHRGETLYWRLGPYADGKYSVLIDEGVQAFEARRDDGRRFAGVPGVSLRIRYDSPAGWITYSPEIALDFAKQPDFTWHR